MLMCILELFITWCTMLYIINTIKENEHATKTGTIDGTKPLQKDLVKLNATLLLKLK